MNDKRIWLFGAAVVAALMLFVGYFVGVAPQLRAAAEAEQQRQTVETQNQLLAADLEVLKEDFEDIDRFKATLSEVSLAVPDTKDLSRFVTQVDGLAAMHSVQVSGFSAAEARPYPGPVNALALGFPLGAERKAREATEKATATNNANDVAMAAMLNNSIKRVVTGPFESVHVTPQNFVAVPISMTVKGDYNRLLDFVAALQNGSRLTLVNELAFVKDEGASGVANGTPAGAYTLNLGGFIYVLLNSADAPTATGAAGADVAADAAEVADENGEAAK